MPRLVLARHAAALRRTLPPGEQRVGPLAELPGLLHEFDVRPATVLRRAGLEPTALADRESRIPFASIGRLLEACVQATHCPHFGLLLGSRWRLDHVGYAGEVAGSCTNVRQALDAFTSIQWMNSSGGVTFVGRDSNITSFGYAIFEPGMYEGLDQAHDLVMAIGVRMLRELSRRDDWAPTEVAVSRKRPADTAPYRKLFRAPVRFDADTNALYFPAAFEATRVPGGDEVRRRVLEARLGGVRREDLLTQLHRMIRVALVYGLTSGDDVAAGMGLTRRTFNRRVAQAGTTFQAALEAVRSEAARQLLSETGMSVGEVALALGYGEPSTFIRAFRRWTSKTPATWRQEAGAGG